MTFLLRKAETAKGEDVSREIYKRYQSLFRNFSFAQRILPSLTKLSEDIEIIVDDSKATGFEFENITAYNRVIDKKQSATAYNILALSVSENLDLLGQYEFTTEKDGDVVLEPQIPPISEKAQRDLTEDEEDRDFELNPEINLTELFENYKEVASKTYDEFQDRNGNTLTFEKAFLYLHYNRHGFLPENAKDSKIRGADIARARKLARRRKEESKRERAESGDIFAIDRKRGGGDKDFALTVERLMEQKATTEGAIEDIERTIDAIDKNIQQLEDKRKNIKSLARESLKRQLPEVSSLLEGKNLERLREQQRKEKELAQRIAEGNIDLDKPKSDAEKLLAKTNRRILDLIEEEKQQQKEVKATLRDASRFSNEIETAFKIVKERIDYKPYSRQEIETLEDSLKEEGEKEKPDENKRKSLKDKIKARKKYNEELFSFRNAAKETGTLLFLSSKRLKRLNPKLRALSTEKQEYSEALNELINVTILGSFTSIGRQYKETVEVKDKKTILPSKRKEEEKTQDDKTEEQKLRRILETDNKFTALLSDEEALDLIQEIDKFIRNSIKIEDAVENLDVLLDRVDDLLQKEREI